MVGGLALAVVGDSGMAGVGGATATSCMETMMGLEASLEQLTARVMVTVGDFLRVTTKGPRPTGLIK